MPELDRRDFLKLVGASAGAAASAGCSDPVEKLIPYVIQPEEIVPGISNTYTSTCGDCAAGCGLHVTTREGRPIKLEGNPNHPINRGTLCIRGQSSLGRAYHPDRIEGPRVLGPSGFSKISWEDGQANLAAKVKASASRTWILGGPVGPTLSGLIDEWIAGVGAAGRVVFEPFAWESLRAATGWVFGREVMPLFDLSGSDLVLDFSSDFLDQGFSPVEQALQFSSARDAEKNQDGGARLVSFGPRLSMTASKADQWIPTKAGGEGSIALALAAGVLAARGTDLAGDREAVTNALRGVDSAKLAASAGVDRAAFQKLLKRVLAAKSAVALPPGISAQTKTATSDAAAVLLLNALLGAVGTHLEIPAQDTAEHGAPFSEIQELIAAMKSGKVDVLLIHDANPVYSLPADSGFQAALKKVGMVVSFASAKNETSEQAQLILPDHTDFESWGDATPRPGVRSIIQPTLRPLWDTQAFGDTLVAVGNASGADLGEQNFHERLKMAWSDTNWRQALGRGGVFSEVEAAPVELASSVARIRVKAPELAGSGDYTLVAYPHSFIGDGSGAALPWLQEIPDPVFRSSWLSWIEISEATAEKLGVDYGEVVEVSTGFGDSIALPTYPRGGIQDDVIAIAIGQGHTVGHYASLEGDGRPGVARGVSVISVLPAATDESGGRVWLATKASVKPTDAYQRIPLTQFTDNQRGRGLAPTVSLAALAASGKTIAHEEDAATSGHGDDSGAGQDGGEHHELIVDFDPANDASPDSAYRWAMSIDNDKCTGCGACVAACYVENNIPIVGEDGMARHREMSWIRIERYVDEGDRSDGAARRPHPDREALGKTDVRYAAMLCQQCGSAPCESVCPVIATYHSPDGINGMVYNRCVGTRYCANNCVYKVRRFNYFDYSRENWPGLMNLMLNPDVTARQQGVMEKCMFCVQRIATARQVAKNEGRDIRDGEVVTACQQTCPSQAIEFGNAKDKQSTVVKTADNPGRSYHSLKVLNTRPAITYLSQVDRDADERSHG